MPRNLLTAPGEVGEIRRLTILFADLVDWTVLSTQVEPETYRMLVGRDRERVVQVVDRFGAMSVRPMAMGCWWCWAPPRTRNDVCRAVQAGLEITARWPGSMSRRGGGAVAISESAKGPQKVRKSVET